MEENNPMRVLREARDLMKQGNHAAALAKYLWIHHHSLEIDPMFIGPRLSYAIFEWVELAEVFPPALVELESVRETKTKALKDGATDVHLFHDVCAINKALRLQDQTAALFRILAERDRELATKCFQVALEALVDGGEFALALSFIPSPDAELERWAAPLKSALHHPRGKEVRKGLLSMEDAFLRIYLVRVKQLIRILSAVGDEEEASRVQKAAFGIFDDAEIRERILAQLAPAPPSTRVQ
jgi:hypothetical protein